MSSTAICSFCSSHVNSENAHRITDTTKEILDILLINLDISDKSDHTICNVCSERLSAALEFKSTCEFTDATIITYIDWEKPIQLDLREIYLRERNDKRTVTLSEDEQVCRLCMELTGKMYVSLQDIDKDVFQIFLPEINVNNVKDPVVCKTCFDSLATHSNFLKKLIKCIDQKEAIKSSVYSRNMDHMDELLPIKLEKVDIKLEVKPSIDSCIQLAQIKTETECDQMDINMDLENDETRFSRFRKMNFGGTCNFCFGDISNENAESITDTTKEILDFLLIKLDLGDGSDHAICNVCSDRLLAAFQFKSTCKYTDATIIPYVDLEKLTQVSLWEIYLRERDNKQTVTLSEDGQVCRLCMELTGEMYVPLQDIDKDVFQEFLPEINVNIVKDPVVCKACFDSFVTHSNFLKKLKNCIDQKEVIKSSVCSLTVEHEKVDIKSEDKPSMDSCMQSGQIKPEIEECEKIFIKNEDIKTEFEYDQTSIESLASEIGPVTFDSQQQTKQTETGRCKNKYRVCHNNDDVCDYSSNKKAIIECHQVIHKDLSQVQMHKCDICSFETKYKDNLKYHQLVHKDPSEVQMYRCDTCGYKTKLRNNLKIHLLKHKDPYKAPSQGQMYKCDTCNYQTKIKGHLLKHRIVHQDRSKLKQFTCDFCEFRTIHECSLKTHLLRHKDPSEVQMHKCASCDYETIYKSLLKIHMSKHKDPSEAQMYKCANCDYETVFKSNLKSHLLKHKDPSELQMYKCATCDFETKSKEWLKTHLLRHKNPSGVYKCTTCDYETKFKRVLNDHLLKHKDPSEVQMYRCDTCGYETKLRDNLKIHVLKHKAPSQVQMYKCDTCHYETKIKGHLLKHRIVHQDRSKLKQFTCDFCDFRTVHECSLKTHLLRHKDPSEVQMHKCASCDYETIYKSLLKIHMSKHKDPSEAQMYKCANCDYETIFKSNLKSHLLRHKNSSGVQVYKCATCDFKTKSKYGLKTHRLKHKDPSEVQMYKCDTCNYKTKIKGNLQKHRIVH